MAFLLNSEPEGEKFSNSGFSPEKLEYKYISPFSQPTTNGTVVIVSPFPYATFQPGINLNLSTTGTGDVSKNWFIANSESTSPGYGLEEEQSPTFQYEIPLEAVGLMKFTVLGFSDSSFVDYDTVWINVVPDAEIDSIWVEPQMFEMPIGSEDNITLKALYSDGVIRDITALPETTIEINNPVVATLVEPTVIKALSSDTTSLTISHQGFSDSVQIVVEPGEVAPLELFLLQKQDVFCVGSEDGAATVGAQGGIANYEYTWSNGGIGPTQLNLVPGSYSITATDFVGETAVHQISITEPDSLNIYFTTTDETATNANDGSISINPTGGTPSYSYLWSTGDSSIIISSLTPGEYCVTITDANGCEAIGCATVHQFCNTAVTEIETIPVSCFGDSDGMAEVVNTNATPPVTYQWSNGNETTAISQLPIGTYTVTITGADGCSTTESVEIVQPSELVASILSQTNVNCAGQNTGGATIETTGGTPPYTYQWNDQNQQSDSVAIALNAGDYMATILDAHSCVETVSITISEPELLAISVDEVIHETNNGTNGSIDISVNGGTGDTFFIKWFFNGTFFSNQEDLDSLASGEYVVHAQDSLDCSSQDTIVIDNVTGIREKYSLVSVKILPNPVLRNQNILLFTQGSNHTSLQIKILDATGKLCYAQKEFLTAGENIFSLPSPFISGLYLIQIQTDSGEIVTRKVVVQ